ILTGINGTAGQAFMTAIFQCTVLNGVNPSYNLRAQWKPASGTTATEFVGLNSPTNTLTTNNWYKLVAKFVNTTATNANGSTVDATLQDMGPAGTNVAGPIVLALAPA